MDRSDPVAIAVSPGVQRASAAAVARPAWASSDTAIVVTALVPAAGVLPAGTRSRRRSPARASPRCRRSCSRSPCCLRSSSPTRGRRRDRQAHARRPDRRRAFRLALRRDSPLPRSLVPLGFALGLPGASRCTPRPAPFALWRIRPRRRGSRSGRFERLTSSGGRALVATSLGSWSRWSCSGVSSPADRSRRPRRTLSPPAPAPDRQRRPSQLRPPLPGHVASASRARADRNGAIASTASRLLEVAEDGPARLHRREGQGIFRATPPSTTTWRRFAPLRQAVAPSVAMHGRLQPVPDAGRGRAAPRILDEEGPDLGRGAKRWHMTTPCPQYAATWTRSQLARQIRGMAAWTCAALAPRPRSGPPRRDAERCTASAGVRQWL